MKDNTPNQELECGNPTRNLWSSVMKMAIHEYRKSGNKWFFRSPDSNFEWICESLDINPDVVKKLIFKEEE